MTMQQGSAVSSWVDSTPTARCFVDLMFIRNGRDPVWSPEANNTPNLRRGVAFFPLGTDIQDGDRFIWTKGGTGVFSVSMGVDVVRRPGQDHHIEVYLEEVPKQTLPG